MRGIVEEFESEGELRVRLTFWGHVFAGAEPDDHPGTGDEVRFVRRVSARGTRWFAHEHRFVRIRSLGRRQRRILAMLWERSNPLEEGLPVSVVTAMVGGDLANTRRAIRTLLLDGMLDESGDGGRIRLSSSTVALPFVLLEPTEDEFADERPAEGISQEHRDAGSTRPA